MVDDDKIKVYCTDNLACHNYELKNFLSARSTENRPTFSYYRLFNNDTLLTEKITGIVISQHKSILNFIDIIAIKSL